ncbi:polyprenyl synthetase family protein [Alphaproteobacteria bacterium]|nr:polyprenyl synthetase family protein [Alphaproteobacteria bacterium]
MKISATFDETQIKAFSLNFDKKLLRHIEKLKSPDKRIKNAMLYFAKTGGKRIRPFLLYYMGSFLNIKPSLLDDFALSIECVHLHSLIHDDLPSMDNDDYRRGRLTVHKKFDEATAVLAGDMFQVLSVKTLAESKYLSASQKVNSIEMLSKANGMEGLIAGQSLDIYMKKNSTIKQIEEMYLLKTGALFSLCFNLLLNVKNLNVSKKRELKIIGNTIGKIFQVTDDMLDRWGNEREVGKKIKKDSKKASIAYKLSRIECSKYLKQIQNKNYKTMEKFFGTNKEALLYMSSLVNFIVNRVK